jgi:hypothetical protein
LADVFEAAERELDPSIGGEKALHVPVLLAVISRLQVNDEVPEIEQRASAGAALGYGAMAVSGRKMATQASHPSAAALCS